MSIKRVSGKFDLNVKTKKFRQFKKDIPKVIAENSLNHFLEGFRQNGGKTDASKGGWDKRKPTAKRNEGRNILVDKGALRRDFQVIKAVWGAIVLGTKRIPYAIRHNEGTTDRLGRKMPQREFAGESKELNEKNIRLLEKKLNEVMR